MRNRIRRSALVAVLATAALLAPALAASVQASAFTRSPAPNCGATIYKSNGIPWTCTFDDEFNTTSLSSRWLPINSAANGATDGGTCFVSSPNNLSVGNGVLSLTVRKEAAPFLCNTPSGGFTTQYTSAQVATYTQFFQTYGRFSVRAKFPATTLAGLHSALWMWPEDVMNPVKGEIDIAEWYSGASDRAIPTLHYGYDPATVNYTTNTNVITNYFCMVADTSQFHTYTVTWTASRFTIDFDGTNCLTDNYIPLGQNPFTQSYFLALSAGLGIGQNAFVDGTTPLPAVTQIDWVRAWK